MGMEAVVVHDAVADRPIILRTSCARNHQNAVETLATFCQHIKDVSKMANSPTEVSALWTGPPDVTYVIVGGRYRILIFSRVTDADCDVAIDVMHRLKHMEAAVETVFPALIKGTVNSLSYLYNSAGIALGRTSVLPDAEAGAIAKNAKAGEGLRGLIKRTSTSLSVGSPNGELSKGRSGRKLLGGLFGKSEKSNRAIRSLRDEERAIDSGLNISKGSEATSIPEGSLQVKLPDGALSTDLGGPLPQHAGTLSWFVALFDDSEEPTQSLKLTISESSANAAPSQKARLITAPRVASEASNSTAQIRSKSQKEMTNGTSSPVLAASEAKTDKEERLPGNSVSPSTSDLIRDQMNEFARSMQNGNYQLAMTQIDATLKHLSAIKPLKKKEILACVHYRLAQKIMLRVRSIESELKSLAAESSERRKRIVEAAVLTMVLASLKEMLPRHRVAAMKIALEKNMDAGNYGISAGWLRQLGERAPPSQKQFLLQQLQVCQSKQNVNLAMPPYNRLCYLTLSLISPPVLQCDFCPATYNPRLSGVTGNDHCPTCLIGNISQK